VREPTERLGAKEGAIEIKRHPFFKDMDWKALLNKKVMPPYVPQVVRF
jgi:hypothetical protein